MKKVWKRTITLVLALMMMLTAIPAQASTIYVDDVPETMTLTRYTANAKDGHGNRLNKQCIVVMSGAVTSLKSSNTSVLKVSKTGTSIYATVKKAGTATVSFKSNGNTYKIKVTVKNYTNPVSSIKIGSTTIKSGKFNKLSLYQLKYAKYKGKTQSVTIKLKDGWTLDNNSYEYYKKSWAKSDMKKNGAKVKISGGSGFGIIFYVTNTKTGQTEQIEVRFKAS